MKKVRYNRPKLSSKSSLPAIYYTPETVQMLNRVALHLPERAERGRALFLLQMAGFLRDRLKLHAPEIFVNGEEHKYAEDLRIAILDGTAKDEDAVAIYLESNKATLTEGQVDRAALYVRAHQTSPPWVAVLEKWGPWPAEFLPVKLASGDAKVISRRARPDEIKALVQRLASRQRDILAELRRAGAKDPKMDKTMYGVGVEVREDLAFAVLRREFGMDGEQAKPHWRPAFNELIAAMPDACARYTKFLMTGRESEFVLPTVDDRINMGQLREGTAFVKELAPFVPNG